MFFDDDLLDFGDEGFENTGADGAGPSDFEADAGSGAGSNSVSPLPLSSASSRRKRGGAQAKASSSSDKVTDKKWRSGAISAPPVFDGDSRSRSFLLPPLQASTQEAEVEMEEIDDSRYNAKNRIAHVDPYPEQARVVKLLDALRLDERSTSQVLLAAGNRYELRPVLDALKIQYPAGMSLTGIPRGFAAEDVPRPSSASTASGRTSRARGTSSRPWKQWNTQADWPGNEDADYSDQVDDENNLEIIPEDDGVTQENANEDECDEDAEGEGADWSEWADQVEDLPDEALGEEAGLSDLVAVAQALTVTSKKLANLVQARGYYNADAKGGKSKGKSNSKGKGKSKHAARAPGKGSGKGSGKSSKGKTKAIYLCSSSVSKVRSA
eukprot:s5285_g3.t1